MISVIAIAITSDTVQNAEELFYALAKAVVYVD